MNISKYTYVRNKCTGAVQGKNHGRSVGHLTYWIRGRSLLC